MPQTATRIGAALTAELPRGFVTFLFTDIEGSTRLFRSLGDAYVDLLERHHELLRAAWLAHRGVEVKTEGDAFFVAFTNPLDAITAAVEAQQSLAAEPWPMDHPMRVRMGIHSGLAAPRNHDYIAYAVHQAARVVGAAHGGQILATEDTARAVDEPAPQLHPLGRFRLRDFDEPVDLYSVIVPGVPEELRPPRAIPAMGHNLTEPATSFVGRGDAMVELTGMIEPGALVSIVGPGGAGKTRLATELGLRLAEAWPDGVWQVEFAPLPTGTPLAGVAADAMRVATGSGDPLDAIAESFVDKSAIVILDNCEHVAEAAARLAEDLVRRVPSFAIIATSREPLGLGRERVWRIEPLSPDAEGVELFIERTRAGAPRFAPTDDEVATIRRVCTRLDGNALAIELAAARAASAGLAALEVGLNDRFRFLRSRSRDLDPRQQSMTALLDWSHDLLEPPEQRVFRRLSAFSDRLTLGGAIAAAVGGDVDEGAAIDSVWALVDKSLLSIDGTASETRYTMNETVREYARGRLMASGERDATASRLGTWYLTSFGPWTAFEAGEMSALRLELDNIRGVITALGDDDAETAQNLAVSIAYVRDISGEFLEGITEVEGYLSRWTQPSPIRAVLLAAAARLHHRVGDDDTGHLLDESEALLLTVGPEPEWATGSVAAMRAVWINARGDTAGAIAAAAAIARGDASLVARARSYSYVGILKAQAGDAEGALEAQRLGLQFEEQLAGPIEIAIGHNNVAEYAMQLGHVAEAARHQLQALELAAQIGSVMLVSFSLIIAARIKSSENDWHEAIRLHGAAARWLEASNYSLTGPDAEASESLMRVARTHLGDGYHAAWQTGQSLPLPEAIEAARRALRPGTPPASGPSDSRPGT